MYYELTQEERASIIEASKPRPYLVMNGMPPMSSMPTINALWEKVAARVGCKVFTIRPSSKGELYFEAEPIEGESK